MPTASIVTLSAAVSRQLNPPRLWSGFQIVGDGSGAADFATNADPGTLDPHHGRHAPSAADGNDQQRGFLPS